jgi:hypothetical protein
MDGSHGSSANSAPPDPSHTSRAQHVVPASRFSNEICTSAPTPAIWVTTSQAAAIWWRCNPKVYVNGRHPNMRPAISLRSPNRWGTLDVQRGTPVITSSWTKPSSGVHRQRHRLTLPASASQPRERPRHDTLNSSAGMPSGRRSNPWQIH